MFIQDQTITKLGKNRTASERLFYLHVAAALCDDDEQFNVEMMEARPARAACQWPLARCQLFLRLGRRSRMDRIKRQKIAGFPSSLSIDSRQ